MIFAVPHDWLMVLGARLALCRLSCDVQLSDYFNRCNCAVFNVTLQSICMWIKSSILLEASLESREMWRSNSRAHAWWERLNGKRSFERVESAAWCNERLLWANKTFSLCVIVSFGFEISPCSVQVLLKWTFYRHFDCTPTCYNLFVVSKTEKCAKLQKFRVSLR